MIDGSAGTPPIDPARGEERRTVPLPYVRPDPAEARAASEAFLGMMSTRRSVRQFSAEPVPVDLVVNAIATAGTAPSGGNAQPWTFVVVSNADVKRRIREAAEAEERKAYEKQARNETGAARHRIEADRDKPYITEAPYLIVVFEQMRGPATETRKRTQDLAMASVGIACGLLLASLHMSGLATLTWLPRPTGLVQKIMTRPREERPYLMVAVGYPMVGTVVPDLPRKPLAEILHVLP